MERKILPYFQPILSVEDQCIFGHEVLAREEIDGSCKLPAEFREGKLAEIGKREEIENRVLESALGYFSNNPNGMLFINMSPDRLLYELEKHSNSEPILCEIAKANSVPPSRIIIEITEQASVRELDSLATAVEIYKELGFRIAMDDVGSESSNLERIAILQPEIIKVDLLLLKRSIRSRSFQSVLEYLKEISFGIGSDLLYEGIETTEELHRAIDSGARFLQGYLLGMPDAYFANPKQESQILTEHLDFFHESKRQNLLEEIRFEENIRSILAKANFPHREIAGVIHLDAHHVFSLSPRIQRVYATDWAGTQVSPYYERNTDSGFRENKSSLNKNWSYLPFYYKHMKMVFRNPRDWHASEPYYDKALNQRLVVFSKVLDEEISLFIDVGLPDFS